MHRVAIGALLLALCAPLGADDAADNAIKALLNGPGGTPIPASQIDRTLLLKVYAVPGATKSLGGILTAAEYADINQKLGQLRAELVRECWAEVVKETGVTLE